MAPDGFATQATIASLATLFSKSSHYIPVS